MCAFYGSDLRRAKFGEISLGIALVVYRFSYSFYRLT